MYVVSFFLGTAAVGIYSVSTTLAELVWAIPQALNAVMIPKVAAEGPETAELSARITRLVWPLAVTAAWVFLALAVPLVPLVFGPRFAASILPFALLVPGTALMATASAPAAYLAGIGRPQEWTKATVLNVVFNIGLNLILVPRVGIAGAAVASSVSYGIAAIYVLIRFRHFSELPLGRILVPNREDAEMFRVKIGALRTRQ